MVVDIQPSQKRKKIRRKGAVVGVASRIGMSQYAASSMPRSNTVRKGKVVGRG
jgi:hypothetical protein